MSKTTRPAVDPAGAFDNLNFTDVDALPASGNRGRATIYTPDHQYVRFLNETRENSTAKAVTLQDEKTAKRFSHMLTSAANASKQGVAIRQQVQEDGSVVVTFAGRAVKRRSEESLAAARARKAAKLAETS